jgi:hypothetical protein|nr:MAG TPA: hypothetical protein [Caudoviricetes sp.]
MNVTLASPEKLVSDKCIKNKKIEWRYSFILNKSKKGAFDTRAPKLKKAGLLQTDFLEL